MFWEQKFVNFVFRFQSPIRPKLKLFLFPLSRPTLKKRPYPKNFIAIFSQEFLFFLNLIVN